LRKLITIAILSFIPLVGKSQNLYFKHLTIEDGLSQSAITSLAQDEKGFLWVGTRDGLNRYDGINFNIYRNNSDDPNSLSNNEITCLDFDQYNHLWVGTRNGVNLYQDGSASFKVFQPNEMSTDYSVKSIESVNEDEIWVGTSNGINVLNINTATFSKGILTEFQINALRIWKGFIWVGTNKGLYKCQLATEKIEKVDSLSDTLSIHSLFVDTNDTFWVGTSSGLFHCTSILEGFVQKPTDSSRRIFAISEMKGAIVYSTGYIGVIDAETGSYSRYRHDPAKRFSLSRNSINALFVDRSGILWAGSDGYGLDFYDPNAMHFNLIKLADDPGGLPDNYTSAIAVDGDGKIWIGSSTGICRYNPTTFQLEFCSKLGTETGQVVRALYYEKNQLWIGGLLSGLMRMDLNSGKIDTWKGSNQLNTRGVLSITRTKDDNLWIGTGEGVCVYNQKDNTFLNIYASNTDSGLTDNNVKGIFEDHTGDIWISTERGLNKVDPSTMKIEKFFNVPGDSTSLSSNNTLATFEDSKNTIWIGTWGGGINKMTDDHTFVHYNTNDGLPSDVVYGFLEDDLGYIWVSTNNGVSRFNPEDGNFINFNHKEGLQGKEFNTGAFFKDRNGIMYFGGVNGLNYFEPEKFSINSSPPNTIITHFSLFDDPKEEKYSTSFRKGENILLNPWQNSFNINFISLNFTNSFKNQYEIRLIPFEEEWRSIGGATSANYTNITPGSYEFQVRGSNNDLVWDPTPATLHIIISTPWYKTWPFQLFIITTFIFSVFLIFKWRIQFYKKNKIQLENEVKSRTKMVNSQKEMLETKTHKLEEMNNTLEEIVNQRTRKIREYNEELKLKNSELEKANEELDRFVYSVSHQLRAPLVSVMGLINISKIENPELIDKGHLVLIQKLINRLDESIREINDHARNTRLEIHIDSINFEDMIENILQSMEYIDLEKKTLINKSINQKFILYSDKIRLNIVLSNLISNSLKYADPQKRQPEVNINILVEEKFCQIEVFDNGIGIPEDELKNIFKIFYRASESSHGSGLGLYIVNEIIKKLNGEIKVESVLGEFTKVTVIIPNNAKPDPGPEHPDIKFRDNSAINI